jgi:penicillin-binding protein 2
VYEGRPGERVSGGAIAAPIVREVFTKYYENAPTDDPLVAAMKDIPQALAVDEGELDPSAAAAQEAALQRSLPPPPTAEKKTVASFFRRLFRRE